MVSLRKNMSKILNVYFLSGFTKENIVLVNKQIFRGMEKLKDVEIIRELAVK